MDELTPEIFTENNVVGLIEALNKEYAEGLILPSVNVNLVRGLGLLGEAFAKMKPNQKTPHQEALRLYERR